MWSFPATWEEVIWTSVRAELGEAALDPRALAPAIHDRTRRYTDERDRLGAPSPPRLRARDLAARAVFFTVADAPKIAIPVAELEGRGLITDRAPLRVLDLGAGVGAMTLGLAAALPDRALAVHAIDQDAAALALLRRIVAHLDASIELTAVAAPLTAATLPAGPFDLIVAGTVVNELPAAARWPLLRDVLGRLAPDGAAIVIEPALRETARALHVLRDTVVAEGAGFVFAPCTRRLATCPALDDPRDWCHEDRPFQPPPRLAGLIRKTGLRRDGLKFAYVTVRREPTPLVVAPSGRRALRVVSGALDQKGVVERIVCGDAGRAPLRILRRERHEGNRALADSRRGDVLLADADAATLERIRPAG